MNFDMHKNGSSCDRLYCNQNHKRATRGDSPPPGETPVRDETLLQQFTPDEKHKPRRLERCSSIAVAQAPDIHTLLHRIMRR